MKCISAVTIGKLIEINLDGGKADEQMDCIGGNMTDKQRRMTYTNFIHGKPEKSGNYVVKNKYGMVGTDDYTTSDDGHWWNCANDGTTLYDPASFKALGA